MHRVRELLIVVVVQVGAVKIYVAAVEALQNKESSSYLCYCRAVLGVLDFLGDVLITTHYPDKCDDTRDKLYTPKLACSSLTALFYTQTLSLSPFPLNLFVGLQRDSTPYFLSCLERKKERKKKRSIQSFYDLTSPSCQQGFRVWSTHK
jgi:hypothetical protein